MSQVEEPKKPDDSTERWNAICAISRSPAYRTELLRAYVRDYPDHPWAWARLGVVFEKLCRFDEAEAALRRALDRADKDESRSRACAQIGQVNRSRGNFVEAERWFLRAIELEPTEASPYIYLGAMLARLGRLADAEQMHRRGTGCLTGCIDEAYLNLGLVLRAQERYEEALECFELALAIDPDYEGVREGSQDVVGAMEARRRRDVPTGDDVSGDRMERWAENMAIESSYAHAVEAWRTFTRDFPDDGYGLVMLGLNFVAISKFAEAEGVLTRSLELMPSTAHPTVYIEFGNMHRHRGEFADAETWYRKVIDQCPLEARGYTYLGQMFDEIGRLTEAEQLHRLATACEPESRGEAHRDLGYVLRSQERYAEALECFELALGIDPDDGPSRAASRDVARAIAFRAGRAVD